MADVVFTVDAHGSVSFKDADAAAAAGYSVDEKNGVVTITAVDQLIEITLNKEDLGGNALSGAEFTLKGEFSDTTDKSKPLTLEDSSRTFSGLIAGDEYTLTETTARPDTRSSAASPSPSTPMAPSRARVRATPWTAMASRRADVTAGNATA